MDNEIERILSLDPKERREETIEAMRKSIEESVKHIAICRRSSEIMHGFSNEAFDKMLNEMCEEAQAKFGSMTEKELTRFMIMDLLSDLVG